MASRGLWSSCTVIWVARDDRLGAEQLFGEHDADQHVRPGERAEGEDVVGAGKHGCVKALGAANEKARRPARVGPGGERKGERLAVRCGGTQIQRDDNSSGGQGGEQECRLSPPNLRRVTTTFGHLRDHDSRAKARGVAFEQFRFRAACEAAYGNEAKLSQE